MVDGKTIIREPGTHVVDAVILNSPISDDSQAATKKYVDDNAGGSPAFSAITGQPDDNANLGNALDGKQPTLIAIHDKHQKVLSNNADNNLFSLPLADGEGVGIIVRFALKAIKDNSNFDIAVGDIYTEMFNNAGSLIFYKHFNYYDDANGSINLGNTDVSASLTGGVVTFKLNPMIADVAAVITLDYILLDPQGKVITFL